MSCASDWRSGGALGLRVAPPVSMVSARIPPMIWAGLVGTRPVLPEELWGRFDSVQQDAVMAHELRT